METSATGGAVRSAPTVQNAPRTFARSTPISRADVAIDAQLENSLSTPATIVQPLVTVRPLQTAPTPTAPAARTPAQAALKGAAAPLNKTPVKTGLRKLRKKPTAPALTLTPAPLLAPLLQAEVMRHQRLQKCTLEQLQVREGKLRKKLAFDINTLERVGHLLWNKLDNDVAELRAVLLAQTAKGGAPITPPERLQQFREAAVGQPDKVWREAWLCKLRTWLEARALSPA